jgi:hypothetical protein
VPQDEHEPAALQLLDEAGTGSAGRRRREEYSDASTESRRGDSGSGSHVLERYAMTFLSGFGRATCGAALEWIEWA